MQSGENKYWSERGKKKKKKKQLGLLTMQWKVSLGKPKTSVIAESRVAASAVAKAC